MGRTDNLNATSTTNQSQNQTVVTNQSTKNAHIEVRQQKPSPKFQARPKSSVGAKTASNQYATAARLSRESLQPAKNARNDSALMSQTNTSKQGSRVTQATLNHLSGTNQSKTTESSKAHLLNMPLAVDEEDGNVRHLEDMMRASQKSGLLKMLQSLPKESRDQHHHTVINEMGKEGNRSFVDGVTNHRGPVL